MRRPHYRLARGESGQAIVEFALASLVFFITVFGTLQFGVAVWQYNMVANLAQEGVRWASVRGSTSSLDKATWPAVQTFLDGRSLGIAVTVTSTLPAPSTLRPGQTAIVQVQTDFTPFTWLIPSTLTLRSTASMVMAR